jgi:hypothetical protein
VAVAPAATQRSCWRSTPREDRNRSTRQSSAAARLPTCNSTPTPSSRFATEPATPPSPSGLAIGGLLNWPGAKIPAASTRNAPVTLAQTASRQRRERSRPPGSSSNGRVTPRAMAGAHNGSTTAASSCAAMGSGRPLRTRSSTQASPGTFKDQTRPEAAYSHPIGLVGRRRLRTSPMTAKPRYNSATRAPLASTPTVNGRTNSKATTRPAARHPKVAANSSQASMVLLRACMVTVSSSAGSGLVPAEHGSSTLRDRYGPGRPARRRGRAGRRAP